MTTPTSDDSTPAKVDAAHGARSLAARISLAGAAAVVALKVVAWVLTGSVSFLSDAAESFVNVASALTLIAAVRVAARPPDYDHPYGHQKAELLSSVFEGAMILVAAGAILWSAATRLLQPAPLEQVGTGMLFIAAATILNVLLVAYLKRAGRRLRSPALMANARHLRTDVWTSLGVLAGVGLVVATGWDRLDPLVAIVVAANIVREGVAVLTTSVSHLLDERLPDDEERVILEALEAHPGVLGYHRLRTRSAGRARFAEVDVFVDPDISVRDAHEVAQAVEAEVHGALDEITTTLHVEPYEAGLRDVSRTPREEYPSGPSRASDTES
ncbi:MAG: cation transporter [Trueperaceae bacterium]|nr:MAG: cation transporter [Trueperaceae bacterium]